MATISTTPATAISTGSTTAASPTTYPIPVVNARPTGPPAPNQMPAALITASTSSATPKPSRRCAGSSSRVRPTARPIDRPTETIPRPTPSMPRSIRSGPRRGGGRRRPRAELAGRLRGAAARAVVGPAPRVVRGAPVRAQPSASLPDEARPAPPVVVRPAMHPR